MARQRNVLLIYLINSDGRSANWSPPNGRANAPALMDRLLSQPDAAVSSRKPAESSTSSLQRKRRTEWLKENRSTTFRPTRENLIRVWTANPQIIAWRRNVKRVCCQVGDVQDNPIPNAGFAHSTDCSTNDTNRSGECDTRHGRAWPQRRARAIRCLTQRSTSNSAASVPVNANREQRKARQRAKPERETIPKGGLQR